MARLDELTKDERKRLEAGCCIVCGDELPKVPDPRSWRPVDQRELVVPSGKQICSGKCRAKRYRARKAKGQTSTPEQRRARKAKKRIGELQQQRSGLLWRLGVVLDELRANAEAIGAEAIAGDVAAPELHFRQARIPCKAPDRGAAAADLEAAGQAPLFVESGSSPGASAPAASPPPTAEPDNGGEPSPLPLTDARQRSNRPRRRDLVGASDLALYYYARREGWALGPLAAEIACGGRGFDGGVGLTAAEREDAIAFLLERPTGHYAGEEELDAGAGHPGGVDPELVQRVADKLAELEAPATSLQVAGALRLRLNEVERALAVLSIRGAARHQVDAGNQPVTRWRLTA